MTLLLPKAGHICAFACSGYSSLTSSLAVNNKVEDQTSELEALLDQLDALLPNLRLKQSFTCLHSYTLQDLVDALAHSGSHHNSIAQGYMCMTLSGNLTKRILKALRPTKVTSLSLTETVVDPYGLNLAGRDVLKGLFDPSDLLCS